MLKNLDSIGRLVIPKKIRSELGIDSETILNVEVVDGTIVVTPVSVTPTNRDQQFSILYYNYTTCSALVSRRSFFFTFCSLLYIQDLAVQNTAAALW